MSEPHVIPDFATALGLSNAAWPVLVLDHKVRIAWANEAAHGAFSNSAPLEGRDLKTFWPSDHLDALSQFIKAVRGGVGMSGSMTLLRESGTPFEYRFHSCDHEDHYIVQLFSEASPAAAAPDTSEESQGEKLECAMRLARSMALDFNNALTSILGHTTLMLGRIEPDSRWRAGLLEIEKSAEKAAEIAFDLATFSRKERPVEEAQATGNLNNVLRNTLDVYRGKRELKIDWKLRLLNEVLAASFDEGKIQQAMMKIIDNSIEAIEGSGTIELSCANISLSEDRSDRGTVIKAGHYVRVEISDSGCGIAEDALHRIFEPFYTTKEGRRGLGLAWVYGIVTNHSGKVVVESKPGRGTWVRIYLPASQRLIQDGQTVDTELQGGETILVVDDEEPLRMLEETILTSFGYEVIAASSGSQAVEIFRARHSEIDLVLTDLVMPGMNGRELMERLRRIDPDIRVILATGYHASIKSTDDCATLQKPFNAVNLLQAVKKMLTAD